MTGVVITKKQLLAIVEDESHPNAEPGSLTWRYGTKAGIEEQLKTGSGVFHLQKVPLSRYNAAPMVMNLYQIADSEHAKKLEKTKILVDTANKLIYSTTMMNDRPQKTICKTTGKAYDPWVEFEKLLHDPEIVSILKRLKNK